MPGPARKWSIDEHDAELICAMKAARRHAQAEIKRWQIERDRCSDSAIAQKFDLPLSVVRKHFP